MATQASIRLEEYLSTTYRPDREYVDGQLVERNVGEQWHSLLQGLIFEWFRHLELRHTVKGFVECRLLIRSSPGATRYRIPDICLMQRPFRRGRGPLIDPPLVTVEVLSPDDTHVEMNERCLDYIGMGIPHVWIIDPEGTAFTVDAGGWRPVNDGALQIPELGESLSLPWLFAQLHED